jgi:hypothetical protein
MTLKLYAPSAATAGLADIPRPAVRIPSAAEISAQATMNRNAPLEGPPLREHASEDLFLSDLSKLVFETEALKLIHQRRARLRKPGGGLPVASGPGAGGAVSMSTVPPASASLAPRGEIIDTNDDRFEASVAELRRVSTMMRSNQIALWDTANSALSMHFARFMRGCRSFDEFRSVTRDLAVTPAMAFLIARFQGRITVKDCVEE